MDFYYRAFRIIKGTYRILKTEGPYKAIHCHNYFESALCMIAAKLAKVDIRISHSHNDLSRVPYSKIRVILQKIYRKINNRYATVKVACSQVAFDYLFGKSQKGKIIYNAIDLDKFENKDKRYKKSSGSQLNLLHVGNFSPQKNQVFLVDLLKELLEEGIEAHLTLVGGESSYLNDVKNRIIQNKIEEYITILPQNTNISEIMYKNDLFLFPSIYEGLGIVLIEAQATGLKCIVSKAIPKEADLGNIEYVNTYDLSEWINVIKTNHEKGIERKKVNMCSYDIKRVCKQYREIYNINKF
ncbi:glycosyltransferase [Clostridium sp.]|uniref:glycosyltransferase n=1 Tax=Clostridium sp. TaxID=1506 RepID=UPI003522BA06